MRPTLLALFLLACGSRNASETVPSWAPQQVDWSATAGVLPPQPLTVPVFQATAHTGATRGLADLKGKPTVVWFYPAANTPG
jgi:cytochrome oxidase Cu insertion factor (SCO1/SenC/PrrC family)